MPVVVVAIVLVAAVIAKNPRFTPDGSWYARLAMEDAGLSAADALANEEAFYLQQPVGRDPKYRKDFTVDIRHAQPVGPIFRTRVLYPWLVSVVYRWRNLEALTDVSIAAYAIGTLALYWLLLALGRPWIAACGAVVFAASPLVLVLAESDLTDMLALACWIGALGSLLHFMQRRQRMWLISFGLAALLLALTRQALFLPIGAVAGAFIGGRLRRDPDTSQTSIALASVLGVVVVANLVWHTLLHGATVAKELEITHRLAVRSGSPPDEPMSTWYQRALKDSMYVEIKRAILNVLPVLAAISMALGILRKETPVLIGAMIAGLVPIFIDPAPYALPRILEAPLYPVVLAALVIGVETLLGPKQKTAQADTSRP